MRITARRLEPPYINPWNSQTKVFTLFPSSILSESVFLIQVIAFFANLSIGGSPRRTTAGAFFFFYSFLCFAGIHSSVRASSIQVDQCASPLILGIINYYYYYFKLSSILCNCCMPSYLKNIVSHFFFPLI